MDFEKCILILKQAIEMLNINMYHLQGEKYAKSVLDLLTQIDNEIGKTPKPQTNFDKITESVESLAEFMCKITDTCRLNKGCNSCPLFKANGCSLPYIKEWLQKECD